MTRKSRPARACPMCKHHKYLGNAAGSRSVAELQDRPLEHECLPPQRRKKNKRRWCKGKVGVEHVTEAVIDSRWKTPNSWWILRCVNCGKHLDYWWASTRWSSKPRPDWVPV